MTYRARVHAVLDVATPGDRASQFFQVGLLGLIAINVVTAVLATDAAIYAVAPRVFDGIEDVSLLVFTVEYLARLWACTAAPGYGHPLLGRLRYAVRPLNGIDLLTILPFWLGLSHIDTRTLRILRLLRVLRSIRWLGQSDAMRALGTALRHRRGELMTVVCGLLVALLMLSTLVYLAERDEPKTLFTSIPATMWWGIATLTTVGYGDIVPMTTWGRVLAGCTAVLGIGMLALPTSILGAAFLDELQERHKKKHGVGARCPTCGHAR
jgi:voltage-gated potassium channel